MRRNIQVIRKLIGQLKALYPELYMHYICLPYYYLICLRLIHSFVNYLVELVTCQHTTVP